MTRCECGGRMVRVRWPGDWTDAPVRIWLCEEMHGADRLTYWAKATKAARAAMRANKRRWEKRQKGGR